MRILVLSWLLLIFPLCQILSVSLVYGQCLNDQQSLLLQLKSTLVFNSSVSLKLVGWNQNVDCCRWNGVACDGSGHVIGLELDYESITGGIQNSTSLFRFQNLEKLNLAHNSFGNVPIPKGLGNLIRLTHLNLSNAGFGGQVPVQLSEMQSLISLDLSSQFQGVVPLKLENPNLQMLVSKLTGLRELYLDGVDISSQGREWWQDLSSSLPDLRNLSLRDCGLSGALNASPSQLRSLTVLRLDRNNLSVTNLDFFANFGNLTILSLSFCSLQGYFPENVFLLPTLQYLELSNNELLHGTIPEFSVSGSFRTILLSYTNFSGSLPASIGNLQMLSKIDLSNCNFTGLIPSTIGNLTELVHLDFSVNFFSGSIPVFPKSSKLRYIDLSRNGLNGSLSSTHFDGLSTLSYLNLGNNLLSGSIPPSLFSLPALQRILLSSNKFSGQVNGSLTLDASNLDTLDLSSNHLEGAIPEFFFKLERLNVLSLSSNFFNGTMQLEKIQGLQNLTRLELAYNSLSVVVSSSDTEIFQFPQLRRLTLASCNLSAFPNLRNQITMAFLDLSNNNLTGEIPSWIWRVGSGTLSFFNLSCNSLVGLQEPYNIPSSLSVLDLHSNNLTGKFPVPPASAIYVDYSSNNFQESIPTDIGYFTSFASFISLANNRITGAIPTSICNAINLQVLDLSGNLLSGSIPSCLLQNAEPLGVLNLGRNNMSGEIPNTFSVNCGLKTLDVSSNNLEGKIPASLANCTMLEVMNVGNNKIEDRFPCMLKNSSSLRVLVLRSNRFHGNIMCPGANQSWPNLQIIDLASNRFSGILQPRCISSWRGMALNHNGQITRSHLHFAFFSLNNLYYQDTVTVTIKGLELELQKILTLFTSIDFSNNSFEGVIPDTIGELRSLYVMNLSHNSFSGSIPRSIGSLTQLESLDLSVNKLTGEIPQVLTSLTFLSFLDLSYNNLVGRIPQGSQFQTFSPESYLGNTGLCGFPMNTTCGSDQPDRKTGPTSSKTDFDWQFIFTGLGFGAGAALMMTPLVFCMKWREHCDERMDHFIKLIYPRYGFRYIIYDGKAEANENLEDDTTDEDDEDYDEYDDHGVGHGVSHGRYCVFCTKVDVQMKKAVHNAKCTCHYSPPPFSYSPVSSSSSSVLVVYHQQL